MSAMMDGLIHNFERKQRLGTSSERVDEGSSGICVSDGSIGHVFAPQNVSMGPKTAPPTDGRLKSILKSPKVRFPEALGPVEVLEMPKKIMLLENLPAPPPPPPPPPPNAIPLPPSLFNKEIEADKHLNRAAYQLYTKFIDALAAFVDLQGSVTRNRVAIQEKRQEMKRLRGNVAQCDVLVFDHLRQRLAGAVSAEDEQLFSLFEASRAARDQVGPMEVEYEPLEVQLGAQERNLMDKYTALEIRFERFFKLNATSTIETPFPTEIEYQDSTIPSVSGDKNWEGQNSRELDLFQGAVVGDSIKVGQLPMRASLLQRANPHATGSLGSRKPTISDEPRDLMQHLRSSATGEDDTLPTELLGMVGTDEIKVDHLQQMELHRRNISHSLTGVASSSLVDILESPDALPDDVEEDPRLQEGDNLLLLEEDPQSRSALQDYLVIFNGTGDRVSRWILHQLRCSRRQVYSLRRAIAETAPGTPNWALLVLEEWKNDQMGHGQLYRQGSIEVVSKSASNTQLTREPVDIHKA